MRRPRAGDPVYVGKSGTWRAIARVCVVRHPPGWFLVVLEGRIRPCWIEDDGNTGEDDYWSTER